MTRFASGAAPWSPQHPPPEPRLPFSLCRHNETQKERQPLDHREGPTCTMTETTKTHVILLACGSFNPITKGHIQMFGESSRPPLEAASAPLLSQAPVFSRAIEREGVCPIRRGAPADPAGGGRPLYFGLGGGEADCVSEASLAGARPGLQGAKGGGWERTRDKCHLGLGRGSKYQNWSAAVRWFGYQAGEDRDGGRGWGAE